MILTVIKRDGREVDFDKTKISTAIMKAMKETERGVDEELANEIATNIDEDFDVILSIEAIQDLVEEALMNSSRPDVAKAYIRYRYKREIARNYKDDFFDEIGKKLRAEEVENSNANVDERSFGGRTGSATDVMTKKYALDFLMSPMARDNHLNNEIYTHDLASYAIGCHNCLTIPFDDLLANGFNTRQIDIRPANSVNTAFQLVAVIFQLQSLMQFGGVSASHLDWTMVPYVRKSFYKHFNDGIKYLYEGINMDKYDYDNTYPIDSHFYESFPKAHKYAMDKTEKEVHQAVEAMYHNLNTLQSRSGNQLPFSSINYGTCTLPEGRMVTKALLEVSIEGLGKLHRTSIFPCGIFQCMKGVNRKPGDLNYDLFKLALRSTAQRLYPNYVNVDWSVNAGYDPANPETFTSTMGKCKCSPFKIF